MQTPRNKLEHVLNLPMGWPCPWALDDAIELSSEVTITPFVAGRACHRDPTTNKLRTGVHAVAMTYFTFSNSDDGDVQRDVWPAYSAENTYRGTTPPGKLVAIPAKAGVELETTEFKTDETYNSGIALTATKADTNSTTGGRLLPGSPYVVPICGIVSRGLVTPSNENAAITTRNALAFYPVYLPQLTTTLKNATGTAV